MILYFKLQEKSYLRNTTGHPSATAVSGSAKNSNAYVDQQVTTSSAVDKLSSQSSFKPPGATAGQMPPLSPISPVDVSRVGHPRINSSAHGGGQMGPVLSTRTDLHNPGHAKLQSTKLAGRGNIACFYIGGEARCCLPLILNSILDQISLHAINLSCDELQVPLISTNIQIDLVKKTLRYIFWLYEHYFLIFRYIVQPAHQSRWMFWKTLQSSQSVLHNAD